MKPLRILIGADVPPDPNAGAAGTVWHTTEALRALGHEVDAFWADDLPHRIRHGNLHYLLELPRAYRDAVRERCARKDYDVIQLSQPHAWLAAKDHRTSRRPGVCVNRSHGWELLADEALRVWHRKLGVPQNRFPRSLLSPAITALLHRQAWKAVRWSDGVLVPATDIRDFIVDRMGASAEKVACVPHGVQETFVARPLAPMDDARRRRILYVGQFAFIKGPNILAQVLAGALKRNPDASATWVCSVAHHAAARALLDDDTAQRVDLLDWRPQEELLELYDTHGILVFPSFYEGAAKACLEAMVRGLCVVATDVGAMRDYITDGVSGFLAPAGNVTAFETSVARVMDDGDLARRISTEAHRAVAGLTWRRCAEGATELYSRLLAERRTAVNEG